VTFGRARSVWTMLFVLSVALCCSTAWAQQTTLREQVESAMRDHDLERAVQILDERLPTEESIPVLLQGVDVAMKLLPPEVGNRRAAQYVTKAISKGITSRNGVWAAAKTVRERLIADSETDVGQELLLLLMKQTSSDEGRLVFRYELAKLLQRGGLQQEALEHFERILADYPHEATAVFRVASIREDRGDVAGAIQAYDDFLATVGDEGAVRDVLEVMLQRARVRLHSQRKFGAAARDLASGRVVIESLRAGQLKNSFLDRFDAEDQRLAERRAHAERVRSRIAHVEMALGLAVAGLALVLFGGIFLGRKKGLL